MWYRHARKLFEDSGFKEEVISEEDKGGYILRMLNVQAGPKKEDTVEMDAAFGKIDDCYIGNEDDAKHLVDEKGLAPERAAPDKNVCSIGYCSKEKKWFGYSHRAMKGFGIGDKAEEWYPDGENKGKKPAKTLADAKQMAIDFAESVS